jgi:hypothetical protein
MSILFQKASLSDKSLNLTNFNRMVDYIGRLANMTSPNMTIDNNPNGYVLKVKPSTSTTMSYSDWAFGFSISGAVVMVNAGVVIHGKRYTYTCSDTPIIITEDNTFIYVHLVLGGDESWTPTIESAHIFPSMTDTTIDFPLHKWRLLSGGIVSLDKIYHLGCIVIPGNFA